MNTLLLHPRGARRAPGSRSGHERARRLQNMAANTSCGSGLCSCDALKDLRHPRAGGPHKCPSATPACGLGSPAVPAKLPLPQGQPAPVQVSALEAPRVPGPQSVGWPRCQLPSQLGKAGATAKCFVRGESLQRRASCRDGAGRAGLCQPWGKEGWPAASVWPLGSC